MKSNTWQPLVVSIEIKEKKKISFTRKKNKVARNISKKENSILASSIEDIGGERVWLLVEAINFI